LYGSVLNTTSRCRNPNQIEITTKKTDFKGMLYLPDMSNWSWGVSENYLSSGKVGGSYLFVAAINLKHDYALPAGGLGSVTSEAIAEAPLENFLGMFEASLRTGYVPMYTKSVARVETCARLFGMRFCEEKDITTWCGVLIGNCQTTFEINGAKAWVPGICKYTRTICRVGGDKGEAEMKSLVTAQNLGVTTMDMPCMNNTGLPPSMNCPLPSAPGINRTLHEVQIEGNVDGPHPDGAGLDGVESLIFFVTFNVIGLGALGSLCSCGLAASALRRLRTPVAKTCTPSPDAPVILGTSEYSQSWPVESKREDVMGV
jgi:hypothetical protein